MIRNTRAIRGACGVVGLVVAGLHLYWGFPRFAAYASVGTMPDPRPLAFVLSGHAITVAVTLVALGAIEAHRTYLAGVVLMLAHIVGYAAWHTVLSHGVPGATGGHTHDHLHVGDALVVVLQHVVNSPLALASKLTESVVLVLLVILLWARRSDRDEAG